MVVSQGDVFWVEFGAPRGPEPRLRRPVIVVQGDSLNRSGLQTVLSVPLTTNLSRADAAGNVVIQRRGTGLASDSVAIVSQVAAVERASLVQRIGHIDGQELARILAGIDIVLGRE